MSSLVPFSRLSSSSDHSAQLRLGLQNNLPHTHISSPPVRRAFFYGSDDALLWTSISVELASTGVVGGAVLRRGGWFDPGLIHFSAETLH